MSKEANTINELIRSAKTDNSKSINFNYSSEILDFIPDSLFELTDLEELYLNNFRINALPEDIVKLNKLRILSINCDELREFPMELLRMKSLTELTITSANILELPKELNDWQTLEYLNLGECDNLSSINGLPPNLTYLYLNGNKFDQIPIKVFELKKLMKLVAQRFDIKEIPIEIFNLVNIRALFLGENQLSSLPQDILKLNHLNDLWLGNNLFEVFPEVITSMQKLQTLYLHGNLLQNVSPNIVKLVDLKELNLGSNNFTEIPNQLFQLQNLTELNFGNYYADFKFQNSIKIIPIDLLKLDKLKSFRLYKNPIENVPVEIFNDDVESIKNFLRSKIEAENEVFLYEAKMVVVGRGDVGKTVLTKKLSNPNYSLSKSKTTKGISILKNPFEFNINGLQQTNSFRLNIWDFGGQEKYDATHQLFLTSRSIYLFLTEARAESNYQDVLYWLNAISIFSNNSPVIVVLSKFDQRKKLLPESTYKEKFNNIIQFVDVSCADNYEYTIENLKSAITDAIRLLPQTRLTLSNHWVDIRNELEKLSNHVDYIDYLEYLKICEENKLDKERADFLSEYLNDLGVIIHHQKDLLLKKTVFLNTDWCVDGMYKVLDDETVFSNNGRFSNSDLEKIWKEKRFERKQAELIRLMRDYGLCFELADGSGFIAPDMLPLERPKSFIWKYESTLQFEYQYTFMPAGMLSRFIVKSHNFINDNLFWKFGVVLKYDDTEAVVEEDYIHSKIKISLNGENKKGLLSAIRMILEEVHKDFDKANKLSFEEMIPCNCSECQKSDIPHFFKFNVLRKFEQKSVIDIRCDNSSEVVKIKELINDVQIPSKVDYFETDNDLKKFILELLDDTLEKEISLKEGYINFWRDRQCKTPKDEVEVHPYICNTLDNYCKVKGINLSREVKEANGNVDIQFSCTNKHKQVLKVCVEVKKAHHQDIETAINTQLPLYMKSAGTQSGIYLVIWFKNEHFIEPLKYKSQYDLENAIGVNNPDDENIAIRIINCCKSISPSRRRIAKKSKK